MTHDVAGPSVASAGSVANYSEKPNGWILTTDRIPDSGQVVLAWLGGRVVFGYCRDGAWIDTLYGWVIPNGPTHWMPLPPPPCELDH
jgi:hypothetical protein